MNDEHEVEKKTPAKYSGIVRFTWGWPTHFCVCCPQCGRRAEFDEPFQFIHQGEEVPERAISWGKGWVVEKYPSIVRWQEPIDGPYTMHRKGVVQCPFCHLVRLCIIHWPKDAYYRWPIGDFILWAWDEEHARVLLDFIGGTKRHPYDYPKQYVYWLKKLPARATSAKKRDQVIKLIATTLAKEGR